MFSSHRSRCLPTSFFHEIFHLVIFFQYSRINHSYYMTSPLQPYESNVFLSIRAIEQFTQLVTTD